MQQKAGESGRNETGGNQAGERDVVVNGETCSTAASTLADLIEERVNKRGDEFGIATRYPNDEELLKEQIYDVLADE